MTTSKPQNPNQGEPVTFAEGGVVPTQVPPMPAEAVAAGKPAPTPADYEAEHGTLYALQPLHVGTALAVPKGGSVPMSHPYLLPGDHGQGWIADGLIARRDGQPIEGAPVPPQQAYPGQYPG